jgi:hypothetical protein
MLRTRLVTLVALFAVAPPTSAAFATDSSMVELSATEISSAWTGPDPRSGPAFDTAAGKTYADDLDWPSDNQPNALSTGADSGGPRDGETRAHRVKTYHHV